MEFFMFTTGIFIISTLVLARLAYDLKLTVNKLTKENKQLQYDAAVGVAINKDIVFDKEGGFRIVDKNERSETVSV